MVTHPGILTRVQKEVTGYALPSILLLITILATVAGSVVTIQFFLRKLSLSDIALVQAEHAAESGVAEMLAVAREIQSEVQEFRFDNGSESTVTLQPWGFWDIAVSEGRSRNRRVVRRALAAHNVVPGFDRALTFANRNHQLVLAGSAHITGDVTVGLPGVTTGSLRGRRTPPRIPISGAINKSGSTNIPGFSRFRLQSIQSMFRVNMANAQQSSGRTSVVLGTESYPDSLGTLWLSGNVTLRGEALRRERPLLIVVNGKVLVDHGARLLGLVAIVASAQITVSSGAYLEHGLLLAGDSISVAGSVVAQLVAPLIHVASGATLGYPSVVISMPLKTDSTSLSLRIDDNAAVEGFVGMLSSQAARPQDNLLVIESEARVTGAVYCLGVLTLDGTVVGTVLTKEFFFYEAPTTYFGWIRTGRIDRSTLPDGFPLPVGFEGAQYEVMDWL